MVVVTVVVVIVLPQPASECGVCTRFSLGADHSMYASLGRCWRGLSASVRVLMLCGCFCLYVLHDFLANVPGHGVDSSYEQTGIHVFQAQSYSSERLSAFGNEPAGCVAPPSTTPKAPSSISHRNERCNNLRSSATTAEMTGRAKSLTASPGSERQHGKMSTRHGHCLALSYAPKLSSAGKPCSRFVNASASRWRAVSSSPWNSEGEC